MPRFELTVRVKPVPWKAAYTGSRGSFTPGTKANKNAYRDYKETIALAFIAAHGKPLMKGAVEWRGVYYHKRPNGYKRPANYPESLPWGKHLKRLPKVSRPDADNCGKAVRDALEYIAYYNDSQVFDSHDINLYADFGDEPRIEIIVEEV